MAPATNEIGKLIEELGEVTLLADGHNVESVKGVLAVLNRLVSALGASPDPGAQQLKNAQKSLADHLASGAGDGTAALATVTAAAMALQNPKKKAAIGKLERDADTVELMTAFLEEGSDGLSKADDILMAVEGGEPPDAAKINALFRVFHSIKGVAGFCDLTQVIAVAHTTETLLDLVRDGKTQLGGDSLNLVFDATELTRKLMREVRSALENSAPVGTVNEVDGLVTRLRAVIAQVQGEPVQAPSAPSAPSAPTVPAPPVSAPPAVAAPKKSQPLPPEPAPKQTAPSSRPSAPQPTATSEPPEPSFSPPQSSAPRPSASGAERIRETLKVDVQRVDNVVEMIGELIIVESMVTHAPEITSIQSLKLRNYLGQLSKISRDLQDVAMRMRMVPVRGVFQKMARLTRDLAYKTGKKVVLIPAGEDTEMDRSMAEKLEEPLVHMVRNSMDHGIEGVEERRAAGKPEQASLRLAAFYEGGNIVVELSDDGRGLNTQRILEKARARGLVSEHDSLSEADIQALIFAPGFSTATEVTELSGRGVGMDVVKRNIEGMRGRVVLSSAAGKGTTFRMVLPLTLAIIDGMLVGCGNERFIIPSLSIVESLRPTGNMLYSLNDREEFIDVRNELLPLFRLGKVFDLPGALADAKQALAVVVESAGKKVVLLADDVIAQQQVVIKPLGAGVESENFSGAAILSDGRAGLILNIDRLVAISNPRGSGRVRREFLRQEAAA